MGKSKTKTASQPSETSTGGASLFTSAKNALDSTLTSLFASGAQAISAPSRPESRKRKRTEAVKSAPVAEEENSASDGAEDSDEAEESQDESDQDIDEGEEEASDTTSETAEVKTASVNHKRRRRDGDDELEGLYLDKLAREEERDSAKRRKKDVGTMAKGSEDDETMSDAQVDTDENGTGAAAAEDDDEDAMSPPPQHETLVNGGTEATELEKSARTVFLGNVSIEAVTSKTAQKTLRTHLSSFFDQLPASKPPHKIESLRFRSTAFDNKLPKKAAFVKKELMAATTKSTNAYAVYSTKAAAREAARRLNGTVVLNRHLRVDEVAHPQQVDHKRCVFVGNLDFVDDDTAVREGNDKLDEKTRTKKRAPGDVEEGLWRQFGKAGTVESVRVVRDSKTRVGKGFAYVQFTDQNGVEAALLFNDQKYPPLLPRKIRVIRAKAQKRNAKPKPSADDSKQTGYKPKLTPQEKTKQGLANRLLGKAGAAQAQKNAGKFPGSGANGTALRAPETFVFEGHRATKSQGNRGLKLGTKGKAKTGKPAGRSTKRAAAWKAAGGGKKKA